MPSSRHILSVRRCESSQDLLSWARAVLLGTALGTLTACTPEPEPVAAVTITPSSGSVIVGNALVLSAVARDASGGALTDRTITWTVSNAAVATVTVTGTLTAVSPGVVTVSAASEGRIGSATITVLPVPVASVIISPTTVSLVIGNTQQFSGTPRDAGGNVLSGRVVTWSVTQPQIATVNAAGFLTAVATGTVNVTATSEGQSATAVVTVTQVPVAALTVSPTTATMIIGTSRSLSAVARDASGSAVSRTVTWTSSAPTVATVDAQGVATAVATGTAAISARVDEQVASSAITVITGLPPVVTGIAPATFVPGATAVITGTGFAASAAANTVTVGGVAAPVLTATETQLTVSVPCVENSSAIVRVASHGIAGNVLTRPVVVTQRTLAVGEALVVTNNAASLCNELVTSGASARYVVAVFSASTSQNTVVDFELSGNTPLATETAPRVSTMQSRWPATPTAQTEESLRDATHFAFLERDRQQYEQLRAQAARTPTRATVRAADLPGIDDMRSLYFTFTGGCADTTRVMRGKAIYVGSRSIIWEDSGNTLQSATNSTLAGYYQRIGQIFDRDQYESVRTNFGDPLLRDGITDGDGRVHMVFSQRLNGSGAAAYVTSCDQFPTTTSRGSNFGQFFYGNVPTTATLNLNSTASPDGWFYFMARTVVHEVKHISSHSARVANNAAQFEQSWLEEGTARHAEEMWVREFLHKVPWKGNTGFGTAANNGVFCDFSPTDATCNAADPLRRPSYGMRRQFNEIREKLLEPWNWSPYGDATGQSSSTFYQTSWSLVRYTIDRYAASDAAFFRALLNANTTGTTNLAAVAGVPLDQLIGGWGLALFADDYPGLASPSADMQFPTWNLRSIYGGLNGLAAWNTRWNTPFPIQPAQLGFGAFASRVTGLRGGAHAYFEISGSALRAQLVGLRSTAGTTPSTNLRVAIARLQ